MLQARFLGQFEILVDGHTIAIPSRTAQSIFAYFLLHPNVAHHREQLAGQFWAHISETNARSNFRHSLWLIRKALGNSASTRFENNDRCISYHPQPGDETDVELIESCLEGELSIENLLQVVSAYRGDLLPGFYEEWVIFYRERLQAVFERRLGRLLERLLEEKRWSDVLEWGERWIASGNTPEPAFRALMLAQIGLGNLAGAAAQYIRCVDVLTRELGVGPSEETRKVYQQIQKAGMEPSVRRPIHFSDKRPTIPSYLEKPEIRPPIFVGRETELINLNEYWGKTLKGQAQVVLLRGEAGSGKSALLQEFLRKSLAVQPDLIIGQGFCNNFIGQDIPYLPFRDVIDTLAGNLEPLYISGTLSRKQAIHLLEFLPFIVQTLMEQGPGLINSFISGSILSKRLAAILPNEKSLLKQLDRLGSLGSPFSNQGDIPQLFEQFSLTLQQLAGKHPLLILLDDLQWMDANTAQLFFHLVRRLHDLPILFAGAYRPEEVLQGRNDEQHPLVLLLNEFQSIYGNIIIDLNHANKISGSEFVNAYLDTEPNRLDETFRRELHRRTQGNPLFTIQFLQNLQERGEIRQDDGGRWIASPDLDWGNLPPRIEGVIGERIGRLNQNLQELLMAASVEGEQFTVQVLEQLQGFDSHLVLHQLSHELERQYRLVEELGETCVGDQKLVRFRFAHVLIQQHLYRQLGSAECIRLHKEIAERLETLYQGDISSVSVALALHFLKAGDKGKAAEYLLHAGDQSRSLYAHKEAIDLYQKALVSLRELGANEQIARTLMKLYLVYHSNFDFQNAQKVLKEYHSLWQRYVKQKEPVPSLMNKPLRLAILKAPVFDPAMCETLFDMEWVKELFCGLFGWSEDWTLIPQVAQYWDVQDKGCRYVIKLRKDACWSDGERVTASDFEFAWKRVLDPSMQNPTANLLFDIRGAREYNQGLISSSKQIGVDAPDPFTLVVELEKPCGYFPYILGDPVTYAVPKHLIEREGDTWIEPGKLVTNGPFRLDPQKKTTKNTVHMSRNSHFFDRYAGNIEQVILSRYQNELEMHRAFAAGELDMIEFLIPPISQDELKQYQVSGQTHISNIPFVDSIYFMSDRPPFNDSELRRAFVMATDRKELAREVENQIPATGGYIPPGLPGYSPDIGLSYDPQEARRILTKAGYSNGRSFPPIGLCLGMVGLKKGDSLVFDILQKMWLENLGVTIYKCWDNSTSSEIHSKHPFHCFFLGWLADYPDPASFLQTNFLIDQSRWQNPDFTALVETAKQTLDQNQRIDLYRQADRILIQEAAILPLFYGHIVELKQPWVQRPTGSVIYSPQWENILLTPH